MECNSTAWEWPYPKSPPTGTQEKQGFVDGNDDGDGRNLGSRLTAMWEQVIVPQPRDMIVSTAKGTCVACRMRANRIESNRIALGTTWVSQTNASQSKKGQFPWEWQKGSRTQGTITWLHNISKLLLATSLSKGVVVGCWRLLLRWFDFFGWLLHGKNVVDGMRRYK